MELDFKELRELLVVLSQTDIAELTLKSDDFELTVKQEKLAGNVTAVGSVPTAENVAVSSSSATSPTMTVDSWSATNSVAAPAAVPVSGNSKWVEVISPMVGTFYRSPAPEEPVFVEVGDRIRKGQTVCIIEAMKLMNELEAEVSGEVVEILVENGEPVEYGQVLMKVNPA